MKYLKLVLNPQLASGHITFVYFGTTPVDRDMVAGILKDIKPFTLTYTHADHFGPKNDIPVDVYRESDPVIQSVRMDLITQTGVRSMNRDEWKPHVSNPVTRQEHFHVTGIESNDGNFRVDFM